MISGYHLFLPKIGYSFPFFFFVVLGLEFKVLHCEAVSLSAQLCPHSFPRVRTFAHTVLVNLLEMRAQTAP